ncbi:MAG: flagellar type III secretion system pore protein FliP [Lachnospiraceae bacterium]|nr:flagellar type III secretion system pore protein FliP [Lachnospiraceae bacterium]
MMIKKMGNKNNKKRKKSKITMLARFCRKPVLNILLMLCASFIIFSAAGPVYVHARGVDSTTQKEIEGEADIDDNTVDLTISSNAGSTNLEATLQILIMLTILSLAPSILIMVTSFTRIIVVLHFIRTALATQTSPPNQVLVGLALFITLAIMAPVFSEVNETAVQPFMSGEVLQEDALKAGAKPLKAFMLKQTRDKDLELFLDINETDRESVNSYEDLPITVIIPAFIISELRMAFIIGFILYLPFIVIDMVVASTLMSMGMMMLPPTTISMPFKILLFVMADGWNLIIGQLVDTFK